MASINNITPQTFRSLSKHIKDPNPNPKPTFPLLKSFVPTSYSPAIFSRTKQKDTITVVRSVSPKELDVIPVQSNDCTDQQDGLVNGIEREVEAREEIVNQLVGGFGNEGRLSFEGAGGFSSASSSGGGDEDIDENKLIDRAINATIVLAAGTFAITKLLTIDHDYWHFIADAKSSFYGWESGTRSSLFKDRSIVVASVLYTYRGHTVHKLYLCESVTQGWTLYEIVRYAPQHNWSAYEEALRQNPILAKMVISGVVYSLGDWIAQCVEGKPLFEFDRTRMVRSGLVGFSLHGSLSHYYYYFCEALFPFQDWWVVPVKVAFDQTVWAAIWNSIYYVVLGFLRFESPVSIFTELKATFWPMLTAGWKLWPFAHLITYGVIPVEQRLLWVDCVELIWVTILSTLSNEKSEARILEAPAEPDSSSSPLGSSEE